MGLNIKSFLPLLFIVVCLWAGFIWPEYKTANVGILASYILGLLSLFASVMMVFSVDTILSKANKTALPKECISFYHKYKSRKLGKIISLVINVLILFLLSLNDAIFTATVYFALVGLSKVIVMYTIKIMDDAFAGEPVEDCAGAPKK
jgi:hypothetical protein